MSISGETADQLLTELHTFLTGEPQPAYFIAEALSETPENTGGRQPRPRRLLSLEERKEVLAHGLRVLSRHPSVLIQETEESLMPLSQWLDQWESSEEMKPWEAPGGWEVTLVNGEIKEDILSQRQVTVENTDSLQQLVNREWTLPEEYVPPDLVVPQVPRVYAGVSESSHLQREAAEGLETLFEAALMETGVTLYARSGYRSYATQRYLFNARARERGFERANRTTALPGQSEHQTGLAMDITSPGVRMQLSTGFGSTAEGQWVAENAHRFGFIIRYPQGKEDITGYIYEPWHLRYVGTPLAEILFEMQLTMEEYFKKSQNL